MAQSIPQKLPLNLGTANEFALVRSALRAAHFDEQTILRTLKLEDMSVVGATNLQEVNFSEVSEQFQLFVRLFLVLDVASRAEVKRLLDPQTLSAFLSLGLLGNEELGADGFYARVLLYPVTEFWVASDRPSNPDGSDFISRPDIVFPAINPSTLRFVRVLPLSTAVDSLDLCSGSGIGAFVLSRFSKRVVSSDLTERATHFATFNCRLNDLTNVEVVCADLYNGVSGQTFDRIVAHPPYVPAISNTAIWRDAGTTGELLVRRIIAEVPHFLRPHGLFCMVSLVLDTREGRFEERVRHWLPENSDEFDIIFASTDESMTPKELLRRLEERQGGIAPEDRQRLDKIFAETGIISMPQGALFMRRHGPADQHDPFTLRARLSDVTDGADFERTLAERPRFLDRNFVKSLVTSRPILAPRLEVRVTHVVDEGTLVPAQFIFDTDKPFKFSVHVDGWMVPLIARFDGALTPLEVYNEARTNEELPADFKLDDFNGLVARMIERGFLTLPGNFGNAAPNLGEHS
jgi:SAM-dependent methyltransferase